MMSSFHAAWSIGGAAGAGAAGILAGHGYGAGAILPVAAVLALPILLIAGGGHQPPKPGTAVNASSNTTQTSRGINLRLLGLCCIAFLALLTEGALANWSSIYLKGVLTGVSGGFAVGYFAFSGGMSVGRLGGDFTVSRLGRRMVGISGALIAALAFAIVLWHPTFVLACICFALIGLGLSNVVPITFSTAGRIARSESLGISRAASSGYAGFVVGPVVIGGLASLATLPEALTILIATMLLISTFGLFAFERKIRAQVGAENTKFQQTARHCKS
jgi:hypothetical protein